jgi:uncharacterized protein involved in outer membrane biogenesis
LTVRRFLIVSPLAFLLLLALAYLAANAWLESAGGRQTLERALSDQAGMSVELRGDFDIMLLPEFGVSGTDLRVGGAGGMESFISSASYRVAVALRPLLDKHLLIESIQLQGGTVYPERYSRIEAEKDEVPGEGGVSTEIERFLLQDFQLYLPGDSVIRVRQLTFSDFAADKPTPFSLDIETLGRIDGELRWSADDQEIRITMNWSGHELGSAELRATLSVSEQSGALDLRYRPAGAETRVSLETRFRRQLDGLLFQNIHLGPGEQSIVGEGCLFLAKPAALHLLLESEALNLDALLEMLPEAAVGDPGADLPLELNLRLAAGELTFKGATANGAVVNVGGQPACAF